MNDYHPNLDGPAEPIGLSMAETFNAPFAHSTGYLARITTALGRVKVMPGPMPDDLWEGMKVAVLDDRRDLMEEIFRNYVRLALEEAKQEIEAELSPDNVADEPPAKQPKQ